MATADDQRPPDRPPRAGKGRTGTTGRAPARDVAASLVAAGRRLKDAALEAGVGERTLRRWHCEDVTFKAQVASLRAGMVSAAAGRLADGMAEAADVPRGLLSDEDADIQLKAAAKVVELGLKVRAGAELEDRLAALEVAVGGGGNDGRDAGPRGETRAGGPDPAGGPGEVPGGPGEADG